MHILLVANGTKLQWDLVAVQQWAANSVGGDTTVTAGLICVGILRVPTRQASPARAEIQGQPELHIIHRVRHSILVQHLTNLAVLDSIRPHRVISQAVAAHLVIPPLAVTPKLPAAVAHLAI